MHSTTKLIALFSILSSALAADVFSRFLDSSGAQIGTTNFNIANPGCFSVARASQVGFTQAGGTNTANGPYCLTGWTESGCAGTATTQQFQNVALNGGETYQLNQGLVSVGSYSWIPEAC